MFAYLSHKLRFLTKQSMFLIVIMISSLAFKSIDEKKHSNCEVFDIKFIEIVGSNGIKFDIPHLKNAKKKRREFTVYFKNARFPLINDKSNCTVFHQEKVNSYIQNAMLTGTVALRIDQCKFSQIESYGHFFINSEDFIQGMIDKKIIATNKKWWQIFPKPIDWCYYKTSSSQVVGPAGIEPATKAL